MSLLILADMNLNVYLNISLTADFKTNLLDFISTSGVTSACKQGLPALTFRNQKLQLRSQFLGNTQFITKMK